MLAARIGTSKAYKERTKNVQTQLWNAQDLAQKSGNQSAANINLPIYTIYTPNTENSTNNLSLYRDSDHHAPGERATTSSVTGTVRFVFMVIFLCCMCCFGHKDFEKDIETFAHSFIA